MSVRGSVTVSESQAIIEGAGVHLRRAFGFGQTSEFDPFLLFDDFRGNHPKDYQAGFPWHPHRGIDTITYVLAGQVEHRDSLGNHGVLGAGSLQWMTAGRGIIHQEMPTGNQLGQMYGFQLWANLPASQKYCPPRYQDIPASDIPLILDDTGASIKLLAGKFRGKNGPVAGLFADPIYLDITIPAHQELSLAMDIDYHAFAYVYGGSGQFASASEPQGVLSENLATDQLIRQAPVANHHLIRFDRSDQLNVVAGANGMQFLLAAGRPLGEPIAWHGPIVMNTPAQIQQAIADLKNDTFLKRLSQDSLA